MKKTIALLTMAAAGVALAGAVESAATFGVLKVASSTKETVICVPWVAAGTGADVLVKDLVKTSNLTGSSSVTDADRLLLYTPSTGKYKGWYLNSSKVWAGTNISYNNINAEAGDDSDALKRGDALIVIRQPASLSTENGHDNNIYLYGQYNATAATAPTLTAGAWHLIAPPSTLGSALSLNDDMTWTNVDADDYIYVHADSGNRIKLTRNKNTKVDGVTVATNYEWVYRKWNGDETTDLANVQAGQGFWYVSTGAATPTVTFKR